MARHTLHPSYAISRSHAIGDRPAVGVSISKHHRTRGPVSAPVPEPTAPAIDVAPVTTIAEPAIVADGIVPAPTAPVPAPIERPIGVGRYRVTVGSNTFDVPVCTETARIANAIRYASGVVPIVPDTDTVFPAYVTTFRTAFNDPTVRGNGPTVDFDRINARHDVFDVPIMIAQNRMYVAIVIAHVPITSRAIVALWRAMIPATTCRYHDHPRYGYSAWAGIGTNARPYAIAGVGTADTPTVTAMLRAAYVAGTRRGDRTYDPADVAVMPIEPDPTS